MNHRPSLIVFGGAVVLAGLVVALALPAAVDTGAAALPAVTASAQTDPESAGQVSAPLSLRCDIKVPNGLAQCGSQASSCKNCHEVKGEDPVNSEGDWHTQHAFGDFCEFCHGGNVQAVEKDLAHQGLVGPLGDVNTNCSSCHADFDAKAQTYAAVLGVTIGAAGGPAQPSGGSSDTGQPEPTPTPQAAPDSGPAPSGSEIVDYALQYTAGAATPVSVGNVIVGALIVLTVAGSGAFIFWNEKRLRRVVSPSPISAKPARASSEAEEAGQEIPSELSPELARLLPTLQSLDPRTLRALKIILSDRKRGEEMLQSLSVINFSVLEEMKRLEKRELSLLLALAAEA